MERQIRGNHPLLTQIQAIDSAVRVFRANARKFYFEALASRYACPACGGRFELSGRSEAVCLCGLSFDPTLQFQKSPCCDAILTKKVLHYVCSACEKIVPSRFLFDERLFDQEYFRERMRLTRERRLHAQVIRQTMLRMAQSNRLILLDEVDIGALPGLFDDLDLLCGTNPQDGDQWTDTDTPTFEYYRRHITRFLKRAVLFSAIEPITLDDRWDKVHRFATLIFMEHRREVDLHQMDNDILVTTP